MSGKANNTNISNISNTSNVQPKSILNSKNPYYKGDTEPKPGTDKLHGVINHTGVKIIASMGLLAIIGACSYATYRFSELTYKSTEEYIGLGLMWTGIAAISYLVIAEIILKPDLYNLVTELYHSDHQDIYYAFLLLGAAFITVFSLLIYSNVTETNPLNLEYERHCPFGSQYGKAYKNPADTS